MPDFNVVDLYKKGYSIDFIIDSYYKWKTKSDKSNKRIGNIIVIKKKTITREDSKKEVYNKIYNYMR